MSRRLVFVDSGTRVVGARIEDYALIGDCRTCALVSRDGSIDWLCLPRFDSSACLSSLLGAPENGRWRIGATDPQARVTRSYKDGSVILETIIETASGRARVTDFMPIGENDRAIIRITEGLSGTVDLRFDLTIRFDYGRSVPWVIGLEGQSGLQAICGPDRITVFSTIPLINENMATNAGFTLREGDRHIFTLVHNHSHLALPQKPDVDRLFKDTEAFWNYWAALSNYEGPWAEVVRRSLITLKALTYAPTGGIVAAATTSLPEQIGGSRNWDYRFCWLRDATLTLGALLRAGYTDEAKAWRDWLLRAVAGSPEQIQIMYGIGGERRLSEWEVPWLSGYEESAPVRVGNAASDQVQLDVYGEVMTVLSEGRRLGLSDVPSGWGLQRALADHLCDIWQKPDAGIWEVRSGSQNFVFSKVMSWSALDRCITDAEEHGFEAPLDTWKSNREALRAEIMEHGFNTALNSFTQVYGGHELDASLLLLPRTGFVDAADPRMVGTVAAIEKTLVVDGLVQRYDTTLSNDGLPPGEGVFLACSFWLADNFAYRGRVDEARALFERLLSLVNDVGLIAEEYSPQLKRQLGNFPQAFTHVAIINTAFSIEGGQKGAAEIHKVNA
jgi:GH15 family glucan-1,4-alpha-glucosidase